VRCFEFFTRDVNFRDLSNERGGIASAASSHLGAENRSLGSPQPGPSGLQSSRQNQLRAPDLQLECLSSDSDDEVTVVKVWFELYKKLLKLSSTYI